MTENDKQVLVSVSIGQEYKDKFDELRDISGVSKTEHVRRWIDKELKYWYDLIER